MSRRHRHQQIFFFDGGCRPNPGPMEIAVVHRGITHFGDDLGVGDNSEAEWTALLYASRLAVAQGVTDALFIGDSTLVVEQASGRQPCRSAHLMSLAQAFHSAMVAIPRYQIRQVSRSKNLAGIALERRRAARPQSV